MQTGHSFSSAKTMWAVRLLALFLCGLAAAQTTTPPKPAAPVPSPQSQRPYTAQDIAQRPYNPIFTPPPFPSSQREQKQFTMQYVYNYSESRYTPAVTLPLVARTTAKFDTPEGTLIAFFSAMRNGDYEAWLECWDEPSRRDLEAQTKTQPTSRQYWLARWKEVLTGKKIVLANRLETVNYVILDSVVQDPANPGKPIEDSEVLVFEKGHWRLSNQFSHDGLIVEHDRKALGQKAVLNFELRPLLPDGGPGTAANHAQEQFLKMHDKGPAVTQTVE